MGLKLRAGRARGGGPGAGRHLRGRTTHADPTACDTRTGNGYVDPALCAACHGDIAGHFRQTGMGRSFYQLKPENAVEDFGKPFYRTPLPIAIS